MYPGRPTIVPDLLAVMDVEDPARERDSWRVLDEGRGVDLVLEFRNLNKKHKDLAENVKDYASLGIAEYFSLDCRSGMLRGWRLTSPSARAYTQMMPQGGVFPSAVLDLELGVSDGRLRFFKNLAEIPTSEELLGRVQRMADAYQDRAAEAERRNENARSGMVELLLRQLADRGLDVTEEQRSRIARCDDLSQLVRWLGRAMSATAVAEVLAD
jgi:hypothetical protein